MRKLLMLGAAAWLAFKGGRGMGRQAHVPAQRGMRRSALTIGSILPLLFVPRWMRPIMVLQAVAAARRAQGREP